LAAAHALPSSDTLEERLDVADGLVGVVNDVVGKLFGMPLDFRLVANNEAVHVPQTARHEVCVASKLEHAAVMAAGRALLSARNHRYDCASRGSLVGLISVAARLTPRLVGGALIGVVCVGGAHATLIWGRNEFAGRTNLAGLGLGCRHMARRAVEALLRPAFRKGPCQAISTLIWGPNECAGRTNLAGRGLGCRHMARRAVEAPLHPALVVWESRIFRIVSPCRAISTLISFHVLASGTRCFSTGTSKCRGATLFGVMPLEGQVRVEAVRAVIVTAVGVRDVIVAIPAFTICPRLLLQPLGASLPCPTS